MDGEEAYGAVKAALDDHAREREQDTNRPEMLMPVESFEAVGPDDEPLTVIGVGYHDQILKFLCVVEEDGEIWPALRDAVYRKKETGSKSAPASPD